MPNFQTSDFDFALPSELIAQQPATKRTLARLLDGRMSPACDRVFADLPQLLGPKDLLVMNDTKVIKARLFGCKSTGGHVEILVERVLDNHEIIAHVRSNKKLRMGSSLAMQGGYAAIFLGRWPDEKGELFRLQLGGDPYTLMERHGHVPLPPYISHADDSIDELRYQSVIARYRGSVAAPTASLHFDEQLLQSIDDKAIERATLTLHVGAGTFQPIRVQNLCEHVMHAERYVIPESTLGAIARCHERGGSVVAVGTTVVRALESWGSSGLTQGDTSIFIKPGFDFRVVDTLITNFHLPCSTLMMLVSAFAGYETIMKLYECAIERRYRFFSYGDAMLLGRRASLVQ